MSAGARPSSERKTLLSLHIIAGHGLRRSGQRLSACNMMTSSATLTSDKPDNPQLPGQAEFVTLIAALMAMNALSIDIVLPALGVIGSSFAHHSGNEIQLIVTTYVVAFGAGQLVLGPVMDRFGRRPFLISALILFALASFLAIAASSFNGLLAARVVQGLAASVLRVSAVAIVRDRYSGREMAKTMSTVMMVFMIVPLLAPALGQVILLTGPWPLLFVTMGALGGVVALWVAMRLPETLPPEARRSVRISVLLEGYKIILTHRVAAGYMIASGFVFGILFSFITASNQIFLDVYQIGSWFPLAFAAVALGLAVTNFLNARMVERIGMRALSHTALCVMVVGTAVHALFASFGYQPLWLFILLAEVPFLMLGFLGANMTALALDPLGKVTGLATSLQGFITTGVAGFLGTMVGQAFDGTAQPFAYGTSILSICALLIVLWVEKGKLRAFDFSGDQTPESVATSR
ncbi:MFS transporter [Parvularcula marina]|uniref:Bcr/CflA family efflux transporter n=2 Tax=Parvularcula marina TaxID=2292771 RepID=A0A371RJS2_9PROT|nr:MFS transporter [Parvularcula marina]